MSWSNTKFGFRTGGLLALWALGSSCSLKHGAPEVGDTVTNWLAHCEDDGDCTGDARCLGAICSMTCTPPGASVCGRMSADAVCDPATRACDLPCESAASCQQLGAGFLCQGGHCREAIEQEDAGALPEPDSGLGEQNASLAIPVEIDFEPPATGATQGAFGVPTEGAFDTEAAFSASDPTIRPGPPLTTWHEDHFFVGWAADAFQRPGSRLDLAQVYPSGRYSVRRLEVRDAAAAYIHGDGYLAVHPDYSGSMVSVRVTDLRTGLTSAPFRFEGSAPTLASIPGSRDWLVSWFVFDPSGQPSRALVARVAAAATDFVAGPWEVGRAEVNKTPYPAVAGGDGFVRWHPHHALSRLKGLGGSRAPGPEYEPWVHTLQVPEAGRSAIVAAGESIHVLTARYDVLTSAVIGDDGSMGPSTEVTLAGGPSKAFTTGSIKAVYAPELRRLGACAVASSGVWFVSFDERGAVVDAPLPIEKSGPDAEGVYTHSSDECDIAWSGREFLLAWLDNAVDPYFAKTPLTGRPPVHSLRARILSGSGLSAAGAR
ncbi:MAG TPA: hypothetical protein VFZ61_31880 [Polyangiales bacterium]